MCIYTIEYTEEYTYYKYIKIYIYIYIYIYICIHKHAHTHTVYICMYCILYYTHTSVRLFTLYSRPVRSIQFLILQVKYNTYLYFSIICINNFYKKIVTFGHEAFKV